MSYGGSLLRLFNMASVAALMLACGSGGGETVSAAVSPEPASTPSPTPSPAPAPNVPAPSPTPSPSPAPATPAPGPATGPVLIQGAAVGSLANPILFVTQVPIYADVGRRMSTFSNHLGTVQSVPRGGDLMIRYPDGMMRNLTKEAGYGMDGFQGARAIAVRDPAVHWSGTKALFSMVIGAAATQYETGDYVWQIYEVSGLGRSQQVSITRVAEQPGSYNNVSPIYGSDDRILFTSDRPRGGEAHLYPQLDEYESMRTVTGIWSMDPTKAGGDLRLLNHTVSGAFSPTIDSAGRVVFTRWDHLQQDQQAEVPQTYGPLTYASESANASRVTSYNEIFPEPRYQTTSAGGYGRITGYTNNMFTPWQINQDGTDEETLNHIGRHEMNYGLQVVRSFIDDPALSDNLNDAFYLNRKSLRFDGGIYHMREAPTQAGTFYAIYAREFGSLSSDQIVRFNGGVGVNPEQMQFIDVTPSNNGGPLAGGRYRNPLPTSDGKLVAVHTPTATVNNAGDFREFRIKQLTQSGAYFVPGQSLTGGISKSVTWWDPDVRQSHDGLLWELEPVEVVARTRPPMQPIPVLETPESNVFAEEQVDEAELRSWMKANDVALVVTRDQTSRDRSDLAQPFNLRVPGGKTTISQAAPSGRVYDISHFQFVQADLIRGYTIADATARRPLAQAMHGLGNRNPTNTGGPAGSVKIFADGSTAAFVPARRAMAWQSTDAAGVPIVRERVWVTFQPGEIRVCASCHGVNSRNQANQPTPTHKPEALRALLAHWKTIK